MRDRRDYRDRHVDRHRGSSWNHKPDSSSRRPRRSISPTIRRRRVRSPDRRDCIERHPVHRRPVHLDHIPVHLSRTHHSLTVRDHSYDLPPLNHMLPEYPSDLNQEIKHKPHGLGPEPLSTHKAVFLDDGLGRSYQPTLKQENLLGGILTGGSHESDFLQHRTHMRDPDEGDRGRSLYARETPLSGAIPTSRTQRDREKSLYARETPLSHTIPTSHTQGDRESSLYARETPLSSRTERDREKSIYARETPLSGTIPTSHTERDRERSHYTRETPPSGTVPTSLTERDRARNHYTREAPISGTIPTSRTERERERSHHARDAPLSDTIPASRTERERERTHHTRGAPLSGTIPTSHLRPIDGGPSSYSGLYLDHMYGKGADDLSRRRDRVSDNYNSNASDEMFKKMPPYPSHDYARDDDYSPRSARDGRVFVDRVHSKHEMAPNYSPRPLHMHVVPFDDAPYALHRDGLWMAPYRARSESPMFPDRGKGVHFSPHNDFVGNLEYDLSHDGPIGRRHHMHVHLHEHDDLYDDDDCDSDPYGYISKRIPVKERIVERGEGNPNLVREGIRRPFVSRKPIFARAKFKVPQDAMYHAKNMKKRLRPCPSDLNRNEGGYKPPHKYQKRVFSGDENEISHGNDSEHQEEASPERDSESGVVPLKRDPPEGSEEFKREVEKAFIKYAIRLNGSAREKKKYLQPGRGGLCCYVCGSDSKNFAETHNLVVHTYHTKKPGLKTAHLGFQKALCLLMGWNWLIVPDESKTYQMAPPGEAKVLKQDRLLWPPIAVICNSSIDCKVAKPKIVTIAKIENMLKGIGIGEGKARVCYGKPANQSVFLVKFDPTLPGYELAKTLHDYFLNKNHGKEHFDHLIHNRTNKEDKTKEKVGDDSDKEEVLYGYMAGIEDLDKLDGTKVLIKSKSQIEAIVEAS